MKDQESYYMIIPASVWNSKELSPNAKLLYGHITVLANKNGFAYCSNAYLARVLDAKIPSVKTWLKQLEELGVISREVQYKQDSKEVEMRKIYIVNPNILASIPRDTSLYTDKYQSSIPEDPDNSTRINSTSINRTRNNNKITLKPETLKDLKAGNKEALFFVDEDDIKNPTIEQQKALIVANEILNKQF